METPDYNVKVRTYRNDEAVVEYVSIGRLAQFPDLNSLYDYLKSEQGHTIDHFEIIVSA